MTIEYYKYNFFEQNVLANPELEIEIVSYLQNYDDQSKR